MAVLYSSETTVEQLTGLSLKGTMLTATQYHDRRHVLPFVLSKDGRNYLLVRQIETGNVAGAGFSLMPVVFFAPYFLPKPISGVHETVADAVVALASSEPVTVDPFTPASVLVQLEKLTKVQVQQEPAVAVNAFRLRRRDVLGAFNHHRAEVSEIARRLTKGHPDYDRLARWYENQPNTSFELLDKMASDKGLSAILGIWVTDFQELSGMRGTLAEDRGYAALYLVGRDETWVLAPQGCEVNGLCAERTYPSMAAAVKDIAGTGLVGYEEDTLGASALMDLRHAGVSLADGGGVMRDWREEKAHYDIPYFVICAMASRYAIDGAAAFAHTAICSGVEVSEKDVDRVYLSRLKEFAVENKLPVTLELYFTNNHAGSRTIYPSRPGNYKLSKGINSLKIDAGVFAFDDGLFHACSDIARTVTTSDAAEEVFDAMERVMLEETIPGILPGMTGEQIHSMGVNQMGAKESIFRKHGYMPDSFSWRTGYPRDIGHVLERQESNTFGFKPGVTRPVHAGMVGCVEFHCAYDGHAMTCEDSFVIDEGGAIVISRGPQEFGSDGKVIRRRQSIR